MHDDGVYVFLVCWYRQESKVRRKERQKQLKKERQAGLPPPKKTRLEDGGSSRGKRRDSVHRPLSSLLKIEDCK